MLDHAERIAAARSAIDYICGRTDQEQAAPVPNCPGWTVYNAASHIGRVGIAWEEMITSTPDDPESRARGYERSGRQPMWSSKGRRSKCCSDCGAASMWGPRSPTATQTSGSSGEPCQAKPSTSAPGTSCDFVPCPLSADLSSADSVTGTRSGRSIRSGRRRAVLRRAGQPPDEARPRTGGHQHADRARRRGLPCPRC